MDILDLLASENYIVLNKSLAKEIGLENAIVFGALCSYQRMYKEEEFYKEQEKIIEDTCLTEYLVRKSIKELKELGLIEVNKKGMPAKYYFKIDNSLTFKILNSSGVKIDTTSGAEFDTANNKNNIEDNNINTELKEEKNKKEIPYQDVVNYLNEKANKNFRYQSTATQRLIKARLNEGFTLDDFKKVIDTKCADWLNDEKMVEYLRPETLFSNKFEGYLNSAKQKPTSKKLGFYA